MADEQQPVPLFPDNLIDVESRVGAGLRKRPQSILPALNRGSTRKAEEMLLNVLLGASGGISAASKAGGDPLAAFLLGAGGAATQPQFADIQAQRQAQLAEAKAKQFELMPIGEFAPGAVAKYNLDPNTPLGVAKQFLPILQKVEELELKEKMFSGKKTPPSPGEKAIDVQFGKEYAKFISEGGAADIRSQLSKLNSSIVALESGKGNLTGPVLGRVSPENRSLLPGGARSSEVQQDVEEVVQRSLRKILGAQFTENEGARLISRTYDPRLPEKTNAKRLRRLVLQLEQAALAKEQAASYFEEHGTLKGFNGRIYASVDDFMPDSKDAPVKDSITGPLRRTGRLPGSSQSVPLISDNGGKTWRAE